MVTKRMTDDTEEEEEVDFPNQGAISNIKEANSARTGKQPRNPIATKNLNLNQGPKTEVKSGFTEMASLESGRHRQGAWNETKRGWMAKTRATTRSCPGTRLLRKQTTQDTRSPLREIKFYQKSTCFLDLQ